MRICLVVHGFPPLERTGVENYTAALAAAFARSGHAVEVFTPRVRPDLPHLSQRREMRDGYGVTWVSTNLPARSPAEALDPPGVAERFADFLDRERPEVIHFQHLVKVGVGLVEVARSRGIPTVYTAHDYYPICHRYTLLRPDLTRCDTLGDAMVCARCDLALAALNRKGDELGDYQMGALAEQLEGQERAGLARLLAEGDPTGLGMSLNELDHAFDLRQVLDGRRAEAYGALDRILAPTEFLAGRLRAGGIEADAIRVLPYGIDTSFAAAVAPRPRIAAPDAPLKIGFLSGMSKHKGAHVLLEAFAAMRAPAELHLFGGSSDTRYEERVRARAAEVGARWHGAFGRDDLARCMSQVDVVAVPSLWVENQPIVIREAFAAGRPVVAPRLGAFPESVRDGVDGLLYAADEPYTPSETPSEAPAVSLARALDRLASEAGLLERLAAGIEPVHDVDAQAGELAALYAELESPAGSADPGGRPVLPSMRAFADAYARLEAEPTRELFARAIRGLGALRAGLGEASPAEDLLLHALSTGSKAQEDLRDQRQESSWIQATLAAGGAETSWMRETLQAKDTELVALGAERDWLREQVDARMREVDWLRGVLAAKDKELGWLETEKEDLNSRVEQMAEVGERLSQHLRNTAEIGLNALEAQSHALGDEVSPLLEILRRTVDDEVAAHDRGDHDKQALDALVVGVRRGLIRLQLLESELKWRREQMEAATSEASRKPIGPFLRRTGLGRRAWRWSKVDWMMEERP